MRIGSATRLTTGAADGGAADWATGANETGWTGGAGSTAELSVGADRQGRPVGHQGCGRRRRSGRAGATAEPLAGRPRRLALHRSRWSTRRREARCARAGRRADVDRLSPHLVGGGKRRPVAVRGLAWTRSAGVSRLRALIRAANPLSGAVGPTGSTAIDRGANGHRRGLDQGSGRFLLLGRTARCDRWTVLDRSERSDRPGAVGGGALDDGLSRAIGLRWTRGGA